MNQPIRKFMVIIAVVLLFGLAFSNMQTGMSVLLADEKEQPLSPESEEWKNKLSEILRKLDSKKSDERESAEKELGKFIKKYPETTIKALKK